MTDASRGTARVMAAAPMAVALAAVMVLPGASSGQEARPELAPLARLVGGRWYLGEDSYHTFALGVGGQSVTTSSYAVLPDGERLISEGTFFYHPGERVVKGYVVAIDMGLDLFEYAIEAHSDTLVMDLRVFGPQAGTTPLRETWVFTDNDHYVWTLLQQGEDGWERLMGGTYARRPSR
jgi:hypothetical protein